MGGIRWSLGFKEDEKGNEIWVSKNWIKWKVGFLKGWKRRWSLGFKKLNNKKGGLLEEMNEEVDF
jgi:hypothetical protein